MKKIIALLIAFVMVFSLSGCGKKETRDKNKIYLDFEIVDNGYGYQWLKDACREFEELVKDKDYDGEEGSKKPGVVCKVPPKDGSLTALEAMKRSGSEVFFGGGSASNLVRTGNLLDITDVLNEENYDGGTTSIVDMMYDESIPLTTVTNKTTNETKFYTIPTYEIYSGMTYDKDKFDEFGFYFAKDSSVGTDYYDDVTGEYVYFVNEGDLNVANRSCGPDGIDGTYDDGMPSSLVELIQLYSYMAYNGVTPLQIPGQYLYEADFATEGLYTALMGAEGARAAFDFTGKVDIVKQFKTNDCAFKNSEGNAYLEDFYMPVVETVEVTEETGYYTTWSVERYYALTLMNICKKQGWFADGANPDVDSTSHNVSQFRFISGGYNDGVGGQAKRVGTMSTGSYWYNESLNSFTNFDDFYIYNPNVEYRNLCWMPLPVNIFTSVTGVQDDYDEEDYLVETCIGTVESTKGEVQAISQAHANCVYFNDNVRNDAATYEALKDWIRFFHSREQLEKTTIRRGFKSALKYEVRDLDEITNIEERAALRQLMIDSSWMDFDNQGNVVWESFYKLLADYVDESFVVRFSANNNTFLSNIGDQSPFKRGENSSICYASGKIYVKNLYQDSTDNAMKCFVRTMLDYDDWGGVYKGDSTPGKLQGSDGIIGWGGYFPAVPN